jgi:drug/metabolite transporter (DMT)-like permease
VDRALLATVACVIAAACWAANAVVAAEAFRRGVSPEQLAAARVVVALVPLAAWMAIARRDLLVPVGAAMPAIVAFGASIAAVNVAYYVAISRIPVGTAISLQYTAPVLILVATALLTRTSPSPAVWAAAAATLVGAALVSGAIAGDAGSLDGIGVVAGVASALAFAAYLVLAELAGRRGSHPATTLFFGFCVATIIWIAVLPGWSWPFELLADPQVSLRVLAIGLVGTLLPFALAVAALRWISPAVAAIATTTEPVLAALLAWLVLDQSLGGAQLAGGALVIAGVLAAQLARKPDPSATPVELAP